MDEPVVIRSMADFEAAYGRPPRQSEVFAAYGLDERDSWWRRVVQRLLRRRREEPVVIARIAGPTDG